MKETQLRENTSAVPDGEKCGDILHSEKEDAQSEASGTVSASEMESALAEFEDIKYVSVPWGPSLSQRLQTSFV